MHPVSPDINKILDCAGIEGRVKRINNKSCICQICNKYFYGWNDIKEMFHIDCYEPISDSQICKIFIPVGINYQINIFISREI